MASTILYNGLARFARTAPDLANALLNGPAWPPVSYGGRLLRKLDAVIRSPESAHQLHVLASAMKRLLQCEHRALFLECVVEDARAATEHRRALGLTRSMWGTTPIINIIAAVQADRLAGTQAESVVATSYYITDKFDVVLKRHLDGLSASDASLPLAFRWLALVWALLEYDVFYLFNDQGLLPPGGYGSDRFGINLEEMQLLRRADKRLFTLCYGADYRTRLKTLASGKFNFCMDCPEIGKFCLCNDRAGEQVFGTIGKFATRALATGLSLDYVPNHRRLDYLVLDTDALKPALCVKEGSAPLRVAHAPNHPHFKGTRYLERAVERLAAEGHAIELVMVSGVAHDEAMDLIRGADVVVDQLVSGNIGLTALEAMALGKPVISYVREPARVLLDSESCPVINADPDSICAVLQKLVLDRGSLREIGRASREYVVRYHSIPALADRLRGLYGETDDVNPTEEERISARRREFVNRALYGAMLLPYAARLSVWHSVRAVRALARYTYRVIAQALIWLCTPPLLAAAKMSTRRRLRKGIARTLWGVTPILTLPKLTECDRLLGLESKSIVYQMYHITRDFDIRLKGVEDWILRWCPYLYKPFTWLVLAYVMLRFDIVHVFCDRGLTVGPTRIGLHPRELELLRRADKRIYTYTYGADVRTRERTLALGRYNFCMHCPEPGRYCVCDDAAGAANVRTIASYATRMVAMGDMLAYVPHAENLHFWPLDLEKIKYSPPMHAAGRRLRVAHAPNHPHFKGTRYLQEAIDHLAREGVDIELLRVEGVPNSEVLRLLATADIVAEQFIGGFHGYTALEAMAIGRPVISYLRDPGMLINAGECPILNANPDSLIDVLRDCATGRYDLLELGRAGRRYVERYYSTEAVAARLGRLYLRTARLPDPLRRRLASRIDELERLLPREFDLSGVAA